MSMRKVSSASRVSNDFFIYGLTSIGLYALIIELEVRIDVFIIYKLRCFNNVERVLRVRGRRGVGRVL
jgi:hypothetical protein